MKRTLLGLMAATTLAAAPLMAHAQPQGWNVNERQATLEARINMGIQQRTISPAEAIQLRAEFQAIARQEAAYRASAPGLTAGERAELDRRFDALSARIHIAQNNDGRRGNDPRNSWSVDQRQAELNASIDAGVREGSLTRQEADALRNEFRDIERQEMEFRNRGRGRGISDVERAQLERRLNDLAARITASRNDRDSRWSNLNQRQATFNDRLNQAVRDGRLSNFQAADLRSQFIAIANLEASYRRSPPGLTPTERADLDRRFDQMEATFRRDVRPGRGRSNGPDNLFDLLFGRGR